MAQSSSNGLKKLPKNNDTLSTNKVTDVSEWETYEALRLRELEEARGRAAQMEKTMRWWSDCTANWREKWSKVRSERNKAREECKQLQIRVDQSTKEVSLLRQEKEELEVSNSQLKKEIEKMHILLLKHAGQFDCQLFEILADDSFRDSQVFNQAVLKDTVDENNALAQRSENRSGDVQQTENHYENTSEVFASKLSNLQGKLKETTKELEKEKEEKAQLAHMLNKISSELCELKIKFEELKEDKGDMAEELEMLQEQHRTRIHLINADYDDEENLRMDELQAEINGVWTGHSK